MRDPRKNYIVVGTFLVAMMVALLVWLAVLSGRTEATNPYYMEFENVLGLTEGGQILYEGYPVGQIEEIVLTHKPETTIYRLNVSIREELDIPQDSMAVITQAGFLSAVVVDIHKGMSKQMLTAGDQIPSLGVTSVLSTISSVATQLGELTDTHLKPLLENLSEGTSPLKDLSRDAPIILSNLKTFSTDLKNTTRRLNAFLDQSTGQVDAILTDAKTASGNIAKITADFRQTEKRLDKLLVSMNSLVGKNRAAIDHSISDLHYSLEEVAGHIREITYNLESTTRNMNEFAGEIRRNPGLIIRGREYNEDLETGN